MNKKLPVIAIFLEALFLPLKHYNTLLKVSIPLIISVCLLTGLGHFSGYGAGFLEGQLNVVTSLFTNSSTSSEETASMVKLALSVFGYLAFFLSLIMAIVGSHRIYLLGDRATEESRIFNWTGNELKYIGWWIFIGFCIILFSLLVILPINLFLIPISLSAGLDENWLMAGTVISLLLNLWVSYIVARWALVLPSSAIGVHGKSLTWSWNLSSGNGLRLTLMVAILPIIANLIFDLLPAYESVILNLIYGVLWLIIGAFEIALLSLSYKFLVENEAENKSSIDIPQQQ